MKQKVTDNKIMAAIALIIVAVIVMLAVVLGSHIFHHLRTTTVTVNMSTITVRVAETPKERQQGLSGTPPLGPNDGMLFIFQRPGADGIWMKDMNYPIDIVWLDNDKLVIHQVEGVSPDTYPKVFYSPTPANYVVELPSGYLAAHHVMTGTDFLF